MTPAEINAKIAKWLGWTDLKHWQAGLIYGTYNNSTSKLVPDWYTTHAAIDLLPELARRGYEWEIGGRPGGSAVRFRKNTDSPTTSWEYTDRCDTIPAAICGAILKLIEQEGE